MGTNKLLLPLAGSTVIARVVDACLGAPADCVLVVTRSGDRGVRAALDGRAVTFVENPRTDGDMLESVRCGLRALPAAAETVLVCPGDHPTLEATLVGRLLEAFRARRTGILVPVHQGRRGHPLVFAVRYRDELLTMHEGVGLRGLLQSHAADVSEWSVQDGAVLEDLDTPADYLQARRASGQPASPP